MMCLVPGCCKPAKMEIEPAIVSVFCISGHRTYFFRNDHGQWQDSKGRMKELETKHTCQHCGKSFSDYKPSLYNQHEKSRENERTCNECANKFQHKKEVDEIRLFQVSGNLRKTPWKTFYLPAKGSKEIVPFGY